ncbi:MAG: tRNA (guanosine(46)-N7)-methyltransferase TrmB [Proteobacteria bacterium]|nr:tRNA (guanosine(46)-N7)-methyltransferase TrmB [Pseudomonadota bacterium]
MSDALQNEHNLPVTSETDHATPQAPHRRIRSFVRRAGRITLAQERALNSAWPIFGIEFETDSRSDSLAQLHDKKALDLDQIFGRTARTVLEIGFGNGDTLAQNAQLRPEVNFLGVEVHRAGVGRLLHEAVQRQLSNVKVICHDAVEVLDQLAPSSLDEVWVLFPDPWHKARHHKRRLIQPPFVDLLVTRMKLSGQLHLATDWQAYAEQMLAVLDANAQLKNRAQSKSGFTDRPAWRPLTRFERRGQRLGHGVWDLHFERIS